MAIELTDKVCLITGADEGIGYGLAQGFARRGAKVAAGLLNAASSAERVGAVRAVQMDVTQADEVDAAVAEVVAEFGRIDVLINNAGVYPRCPVDQMTFADYAAMREVNLDGAWRCCLAVIPHMKAQRAGSIINIGSVTLRLGLPELAHYESTKGGILGMTRGMARDLGAFGVRVNCLHLGAVRTEGEMRLKDISAQDLTALEGRQSLPGRLTPESIEPAFAFFASEESGDITGQSLTVDRGWIHD